MRAPCRAVALALVAAASAHALPESPLLAIARGLQSSRAASCGGAQEQELRNENRFCDVMNEPSNSVSFAPCCPSEDAALPGQSGAEPVCRVAQSSAAYCSPDNVPACTSVGPADQMLLNLALTTAPASQACCQTCSCKGDPECTAFSGAKNIEINCDGRRPDNCQIKRAACRKQRDRAGQRCLWLKDKEFAGEWSSFDEDGSPCQSDYANSGYPTMVMYEFPNFKVELTTAERGVIRNISITVGDDEYTLNSFRGFELGAAPEAWTVSVDGAAPVPATELPDGWVGGPATMSVPNLGDDDPSNDAPTVAEWPWQISTENGVLLDLVVTRPLNRERLSRIDVLSLIELDIERQGAAGYCVDNEIPRGRSTWRKSTRIHDKCTAVALPDLLTTCKALTGIACRPATTEQQLADWCDRADLINTEVNGDIDDCKALVVPKRGDSRSVTAARNLAITRLVCQLNRDTDVQDCVSLISQFGWPAYLQTNSNGLPSTAGGNGADTCVDDVSKYSTSDGNTCAQGVSVQYFDETEDMWIESFFVPANKPPCGGRLRVFGDQHPELFMNPVRVSQCDLDASCLTENQCQPAVGFRTSLLFSTDTCNNQRPDCFNCANTFPPPSQTPQVCVLEPASPTPVGQCITCCSIDDILNPGVFGGPLCRDVTMPALPYCNPADPQFAALCNAPTLEAGAAELELYIERDSAQISCCATCSTYGDPLGVSFDGTRDKYILCDGRNSRCKFSSNTCRNQRDQKNRQCRWDSALARKPQGEVNVFGSPCQPADYDDATVLVYDIAGVLGVVAQLGERAIITELVVSIPEGTYVLSAVQCFGAGSEPQGWTWTPSAQAGSDGVDVFFALSQAPTDTPGEITQMLTHFGTGVMVRIKCIQSTLASGEVGGQRIDVQALVDTNETRVALIEAGDPSFTGFCPTGTMSEKTKQNANGDRCQQQNVNDAVRICSALADPACRRQDVQREARAWCTRAALPYGADICFDHIWDDINRPLRNLDEVADAWTREYCTAIVSRRATGETPANFIELCVSEVELEGIDSAVAKWGDGTDLASYCAVNYTAYKARASGDDELNCVTGISVQTQNPDTLAWEELFFMPDNFPPCASPFVIPANAETLPLFTRRVRLHQCDLSQNDCPLLGNEDTHCLSNQGFELAYRYTHGDGLCPET